MLESITSNTSTIATIAAEARANDVDIILFPELFLTGYNIPPARQKQLAISQHGEEMSVLRCIASTNEVAIAFGYAENDPNEECDKTYNSCILLDGTGETVLNYRKCHLWDPYREHEKLAFEAGDCLPVRELTLTRSGLVVRIGILVCFDCEFPEPARVLALGGADVILISTALAEGPVADSTPVVTVPARAAENNIFIVYSNLIGSAVVIDSSQGRQGMTESAETNFCGQSAICGPDGSDLVRASKTGEGMFVATLNSSMFESFVRRNNYLIERRPELYHSLIPPNNRYNASPYLHFNAAGDSPMPSCVLQKVKDVLDDEHSLGGYAALEELYSKEFANVYNLIGRLINCSPENIALVDSATTAWNKAFYSIRLQEGDIILCCKVEYASNYVAMLQQSNRCGAVILEIPSCEDGTISLDAFAHLLDEHGEKVKIVSITWIPTNGGVVNDAAAIGDIIESKVSQAVYILDACQAVGHIPVDVQCLKCHFLSATGRKYLRGPRGTGFLYVSRAALRVFNDPVTIDLFSAPFDGGTYKVDTSAKRFEQWEKNVAGLIGMGEAVKYLMTNIGCDWAYKKIAELAILLREKLMLNDKVVLWDLGTVEKSQSRCGIVTFSVINMEADDVKVKLRESNIFVSTSGPSSTPLDSASRKLPKLVRASVHYFNSPSEIELLAETIKALTTSPTTIN